MVKLLVNVNNHKPMLMVNAMLHLGTIAPVEPGELQQDLVEDRMKNDLSHIEVIARTFT